LVLCGGLDSLRMLFLTGAPSSPPAVIAPISRDVDQLLSASCCLVSLADLWLAGRRQASQLERLTCATLIRKITGPLLLQNSI